MRKSFNSPPPNACTRATAPLRTHDTAALLAALGELAPPFDDDDVAAELIALAFVHETAGVRKKATALAKKHIPDFAQFKAAYRTLAGQGQHVADERVRAFEHRLQVGVSKAMLFHRLIAASIAFEKDAETRAAILAVMVANAKRERDSEVMLGDVLWNWQNSSGWASNIELHEVPPTLFKELSALRKQHPFTGVSFHGGELTSLPASIVGARSWLESLSLDWNPFTVFPEVVLKCSNLERLSLLGTELTDIPASIAKLKKLRFLDLGNGKKMKSIPESVCALDRLEVLRIGNGSIRVIPEAIGQMKSLRELQMQSTGVTKVPASLGSLPRLETISMAFSDRLDPARVRAVVGSGVKIRT